MVNENEEQYSLQLSPNFFKVDDPSISRSFRRNKDLVKSLTPNQRQIYYNTQISKIDKQSQIYGSPERKHQLEKECLEIREKFKDQIKFFRFIKGKRAEFKKKQEQTLKDAIQQKQDFMVIQTNPQKIIFVEVVQQKIEQMRKAIEDLQDIIKESEEMKFLFAVPNESINIIKYGKKERSLDPETSQLQDYEFSFQRIELEINFMIEMLERQSKEF